MKKFNVLFISVFVLLFISCEEETIIFDSVNGQTGISFAQTDLSLTVPEEGLDIELPVNSTTVSTSERTFAVTVLETSVGDATNYSIGSVVIPANSYTGILQVGLNFEPLVEGQVYILNLELTAPEGGVTFDGTASIEYLKEIICNDFVVTIVTDRFGSETSWEITDTSGTVVASEGPFVDVTGGDTYTSEVFLEDGCYTFTIFDSYGDGQVDGTVTGSYAIACSIVSVATGGGAFGSSESAEFCVNQ